MVEEIIKEDEIRAKQLEEELESMVGDGSRRSLLLPTIEPTELDKSYVAGLFDGEGMVSVNQVGVGVNAGYFQIKCSITNTNLPVLEWVKERFGGAVHGTEGRLQKYQPVYRVEWHSENCKKFIAQILPYTRIKKQQIEVALQFPMHRLGQRRTQEFTDAQWKVFEALRQAKYRVEPIPQQYLENLAYTEHNEHLRKKEQAIELRKAHPDWSMQKIGEQVGVSKEMVWKYLKDSGLPTKKTGYGDGVKGKLVYTYRKTPRPQQPTFDDVMKAVDNADNKEEASNSS